MAQKNRIGDVLGQGYHGSKISGSQQTVVLQIPGCKYGRKDEKIDVEDFPVHGCTQELNSSPYFSSLS